MLHLLHDDRGARRRRRERVRARRLLDRPRSRSREGHAYAAADWRAHDRSHPVAAGARRLHQLPRSSSFPDITADGSITLGAAVAAVLIVARHVTRCSRRPPRSRAGALAGATTGVLHTRFKINRLLVGHPGDDRALLDQPARHGQEQRAAARRSARWPRWPSRLGDAAARRQPSRPLSGWEVGARDLAVLGAGAGRRGRRRRRCSISFLRTNLGTAMQATGDNAQMIRALGVNVDNMIVLGLALSNGLIALVGRAARAVPGLRRRADGHRHGGVGPRQRHHRRGAGRRRASSGFVITGAVMGSVLFRLLVAIALRGGLNPNDLKLITAVFVFVALVLPALLQRMRRGSRPSARRGRRRARHRQVLQDVQRGHAERGARAARRRPHHRRRLVRHRHRHERLRQVDAAQRRRRRVSRSTPARSRSTARDVTTWPEHRRAKLIGRVFQNPFSGTAPSMSIAENLALAARRGRPRGLGWALEPVGARRARAIACAA